MPRRGFSLIEVVLAIGLFLLFSLGIYSGTTFVFKSVYQSRLRILEAGILGEQVEIIRNLAYADVGIVSGSPAGVLARVVTTTRNGIPFTITRTIRNIDDPYDGVIGGAPNDTAPADYKMVDIEIVCDRCGQRQPLSFVSSVGPKYLEGDPTHGALFIRVFDAAAVAVQGASVHVVATSTSPIIDLVDTTDNQGMLRLVDLPAGIGAYHLTVTKAGYTSDQTVAPSDTVPNPVKPPVSVTAQTVTEISFSIDHVASLGISTVNSLCLPVGAASLNIIGTKFVGTDPDVFLVNQNFITDGLGHYTFANAVWDNYGLRPASYDLLGSIPPLPIALAPGVDQPVTFVLGTNTVYSLLVNVRDSITGQSVSTATVIVTSTDYSQSRSTGVGFIRQTDWSGGAGQLMVGSEARYWAGSGIDATQSAGDLKLAKVGQQYFGSGQLESSIFDVGTTPNYVNINWEPLAQPEAAGSGSLRFQLATSLTTSSPTWLYVGPDGTTSTFYDASDPVVAAIHSGQRYIRYQVYLSTASSTVSPTLSDINVTYTNSCTPPGQAYFGGLANQDYNVVVTKTGYQPKTQTLTVSGDMVLAVDLVDGL
ncbi:MAG: prepilin-type N-terminal cleavage/methylation domain-containing protein [Candidatus Magasanikbacteria bacterium]|nr:prepilin-type N-terminal cleavage/methylation domain-containing protein [Candidatus Magasanikbacteria bacterium]